MRYVMLLRGVNVGGRNKVIMTELIREMEEIGFTEVKSYINSGNLFFNSDEKETVIHEKMDKLLNNYYVFNILFVIISATNFEKDYLNLPNWWNEPFARKNVLFYTKQVDKEELHQVIMDWPLGDEIVHFGDIAVYWGKYKDETYLKTAYSKKLIKAPFYKQITIRNGNTYEKIYELLQNK